MTRQVVRPQEPGAPEIPQRFLDREQLNLTYPKNLGVIALNRDGVVVQVNDRAVSWGRQPAQEYLDEDLTAEGRGELIQQALEGTPVHRSNVKHRSRRRGEITQNLDINPILDEQGRGVSGVLVMIDDRTYEARLREIEDDIAADSRLSSVLGKIAQYAVTSLMESESNPKLRSALRLVEGDNVVRVVHAGPWERRQIQSLYEMESSAEGRRFRPLGPLTQKTMREGSVIIPNGMLSQSVYPEGIEPAGVYSEGNPVGLLLAESKVAERGITSLASFRIGGIGTLTVYNLEDITGEEAQFLEALAGKAEHAIRRTRVDEQLRSAQEKLEGDMVERDRFTHSLIHDIRGPIQTSLGFLNRMGEEHGSSLPGAVSASLGEASESIHRVGRLIESVAQDIRTGQLGLNIEECRLEADIISPAVDAAAGNARDKNISFSISVPEDTPNILADAVKVSMQVLGNLVGNAVKYTPEGENIEISARRQGLSFVEVSVKNPGPTIPPEKQEAIFEEGVQVDAERDRQLGAAGTGLGAGLGLATAKRVVEAHGGQIQVISGEGVGTIFSFTLPAKVEYPEVQVEGVLAKFLPFVENIRTRFHADADIEASRGGEMVSLNRIGEESADGEKARERIQATFGGEHRIRTDETIIANAVQMCMGATLMEAAIGLQQRPEGERTVRLFLTSEGENEVIRITNNGVCALPEETIDEMNLGAYRGEENKQLADALRDTRGMLRTIRGKVEMRLLPEGGSAFVVTIPKTHENG